MGLRHEDGERVETKTFTCPECRTRFKLLVDEDVDYCDGCGKDFTKPKKLWLCTRCSWEGDACELGRPVRGDNSGMIPDPCCPECGCSVRGKPTVFRVLTQTLAGPEDCWTQTENGKTTPLRFSSEAEAEEAIALVIADCREARERGLVTGIPPRSDYIIEGVE